MSDFSMTSECMHDFFRNYLLINTRYKKERFHSSLSIVDYLVELIMISLFKVTNPRIYIYIYS